MNPNDDVISLIKAKADLDHRIRSLKEVRRAMTTFGVFCIGGATFILFTLSANHPAYYYGVATSVVFAWLEWAIRRHMKKIEAAFERSEENIEELDNLSKRSLLRIITLQ